MSTIRQKVVVGVLLGLAVVVGVSAVPAMAMPLEPVSQALDWLGFFWRSSLFLGGVLAVLIAFPFAPLIMEFIGPDGSQPYRYLSDAEQTAQEFIDRLTPEEARRYVGVVGGGPAGLRTAELIQALNAHLPEDQRRTVLIFDRNQVLSGLGAYGIPPVAKQAKLKDSVLLQTQSVSHGMAVAGERRPDSRLVGRDQWRGFSKERFLQVVKSRYFRFFPQTNVDGALLSQMEALGIPLVIATGAQAPRFHTDADGNPLPGYEHAGVVLATSQFFRKIGTEWLEQEKGVQGVVYEGKDHDLTGKKFIVIIGGGNVASDAFMWAFRNAPEDATITLVYRGPLDAMSNMSRSYLKPIGKALQVRRTATPMITEADLDVEALKGSLRAGRVSDEMILEALLHLFDVPSEALDDVTPEQMLGAISLVQKNPGLSQRLAGVVEPRGLRLDFHPLFRQAIQEPDGLTEDETLAVNRLWLEALYPTEIHQHYRANMFGLLTVEDYLDKDGDGKVDHIRVRVQKLGDIRQDEKGIPLPMKYKVTKRQEVMRHPYTQETVYDQTYSGSDDTCEIRADLVIEAIGDLGQPLGDIPMNRWGTAFEADEDTGRVAGRLIWVAGQALTQIGAVRDSWVSAENSVYDMIPVIFPRAARALRDRFDAIVYKDYDKVGGEKHVDWDYRRPARRILFHTEQGASYTTSKDGPEQLS